MAEYNERGAKQPVGRRICGETAGTDQKASAFYQFDGFFDLHYGPSTLEMAHKGDLIGKIAACFEKIKPECVILPDPNDSHKDHRVTYESCMSCTKVFRYPYIKQIMTMEILSETDFGDPYCMFAPNYFVDVSDTLEKSSWQCRYMIRNWGSRRFQGALKPSAPLQYSGEGWQGCVMLKHLKL